MKRYVKGIILPFVFLSLFYSAAYSIDDRQGLGVQPQQPQQPPQQFQPPKAQGQEPYQHQQPPRPIIPPVLPAVPIGISPTLSPHITTPAIAQTNITTPQFTGNPQPITIQTNFQSAPAQALLPNTNMQTELPEIPIIGNSLGKVIETGIEKEGLPWIKVKDDIFNETLKIQINPKSTPVIKKSSVFSYRDIKIGDTVNVIFNQKDENITANFVSILTEEDLKAMEESLKADSNLKIKDSEPLEDKTD